MFLAVILSNGCYLMKIAILKRKHTIFFALLDKNLSIPNKKIGKKLLFYSCVKIVDGGLHFYFLFSLYFIFIFIFSFIFQFLEQLGLGFISHAVTSVTS